MSGAIPMSKLLPNQGNASISRCASLLNIPLAKIQPAWSPIGSQRDCVQIRASARIHPRRNKVVKPAPNNIGSLNCENELAIETNPEPQVASVVTCSGDFKKCKIEHKAEVNKIDIIREPLRRRTPRITPRKKTSSITGTMAAVRRIEPSASHEIVSRSV